MSETFAKRHHDGSAGDANYGVIGADYASFRQPDPHIAAQIDLALGAARIVLNVGAGAGSYEPRDRQVTPVEPSASMRAQRPNHLSQAIDATAENLPFGDKVFDASLATFTIHQWTDIRIGLKEMRRVTRGPIVILTCDPDELTRFWLNDYAPEVLETEARRYPSLKDISSALGEHIDARAIPIPLDCRDGFNEAYYGRPELLLRPDARSACSAWSFLDSNAIDRFAAHLRHDLESGAWDSKYGQLRAQPTFEGSLTLIVAPGSS